MQILDEMSLDIERGQLSFSHVLEASRSNGKCALSPSLLLPLPHLLFSNDEAYLH